MAKPGRRPNPTHLKLLKGETRPSRVNYNEPIVDNDEIAPVMELTEDERKVWDQVVPGLARARILGNTDSIALTQLCQLEAARRVAHTSFIATGMLSRGSTGQPIISPTYKLMMDTQNQVMKLLAEFGMTPSSRSRIDAPPSRGKPRGFDID